MSSKLRFIALSVFGCLSVPAFAAPLKVVTTIPELAWIASEMGGPLVEARALLSGVENPHYVDAVPNYVRLAAEADVFCMVGLDLEVGYAPAILSRSGNARVQPGGSGFCEVSRSVTVLEKPHGPVDRSMGDVHPGGNPHFYLSPRALAQAADEIGRVLSHLRPGAQAGLTSRLTAVKTKLQATSESTRALLAPILKSQDGPLVIEYHKEFAYYFQEFGISSFGSIEEKPGVPPSAGRIAEVALAAKKAGVRLVLAADYAPMKTLQRFSEISGIPLVIVPTMIQSSGAIKDYAQLQAHIAEAIAKHAGAPKSLPEQAG